MGDGMNPRTPRRDRIDAVAQALMEAWATAEPHHVITNDVTGGPYPVRTGYVATFADMARAVVDLEEATTETHWRVAGLPGNGAPAYDFIWRPDLEALAGRTPEQAARDLVARVNETGGWEEGPALMSRHVITTEWKAEK